MTAKMSARNIAQRVANGERCAECQRAFAPDDSCIKYCSSRCSGEALHRRANDPARVAARFWAKVNKAGPTMAHMQTACWEWTSTRDRKGYGHLSFAHVKHGFKNSAAHRVSWWLHHGRWPTPMALHHCDNPACVNPEHLYEGDVRDNSRDMYARGRANRPRGEETGCAVLTEAKVRAIRSARSAGAKRRPLADLFGVSTSTIDAIVTRRSWGHVG